MLRACFAAAVAVGCLGLDSAPAAPKLEEIAQTETAPSTLPAPKLAAERGYLGITIDDRQDRGRGVRIIRIAPGSPAEKAGLKVDDLIVDVGGSRVRQLRDAAAVIEQVPPGGVLPMEFLRGETRQKVEVTFGRKGSPDMPGAATSPPTLPAYPSSPADSRAEIEALKRRIEELERRLEALEASLREKASR